MTEQKEKEEVEKERREKENGCQEARIGKMRK